MSTGEENKAIVREMLKALDDQNFEALGAHPGLHQTIQRHPLMSAAFPDAQTVVEEQIAEGNVVATRARTSGTHLGAFMGAAPTGKHLTWNVLLMDEIVDGKIVLHFANANYVTLLVQLGIIPPPPAPSAPLH